MSMIEPIAQLVGQLSRLPGVGRKSAQRLAFHILSMEEGDVRQLAEALWHAKRRTHSCPVCGNWAEGEKCLICLDDARDATTICVVGDARDVYAIERARDYRGLYHVLGGLISPMDDRGPDDIRIAELLGRLEGVREIILATNPDIEGEATAAYIARLMEKYPVKVTRIAHGVPVGGDLEYADDATLQRAMAGRTTLNAQVSP
jgi:recombination protein RecR